MKLAIIIITIRLIVSNCDAVVRKIRSFQNTDFANIKILENPNAAYSVRSLLDCNKVCSETTSCLSCAYNCKTRSCLLWDTDFVNISTTNVVNETGWMYHYVVKDCTITENMCLSNNGFIYEPQTCFCFKYLSTKYIYNDSVSACAAMHANLAKISRGLIQLKMEKFLDTVIDGDVRIQGELDKVDNIWKYKDGSEIKYFYWNTAAGQPDNRANNEMYISLRKTSGYRWHDASPTSSHAAICQITSV